MVDFSFRTLQLESNRDSSAGSMIDPVLKQISPRHIIGAAVGLLLSTALAFLFLWYPAYSHLQVLAAEKTHWQTMLSHGVPVNSIRVPQMEQLPELLEQCRNAFEKQGVKVKALNVERFGEQRETDQDIALDYALVRLRLNGPQREIVGVLKGLEERKDVGIQIQEAVLTPDGGETLLQIYLHAGK